MGEDRAWMDPQVAELGVKVQRMTATADRSVTRPTQLDPSQLSLTVLNALNMTPDELATKLRENPIQCIEYIVARTQIQVDKESNALKPRETFSSRRIKYRSETEYQERVEEAEEFENVKTKRERHKEAYLKRFLSRFRASVLERLNPFARGVRRVEAHFGTGIASLFQFEQSVIWLNFWMSLLWVAFVNIPWGVNPPASFRSANVQYKGLLGLGGMETSW